MNKSQMSINIVISTLLLIGVITLLTLIVSSSYAASPQAIAALSNNPLLAYAPDSILVKFKAFASPAQKRNVRAFVNGEKMRGYRLVEGLEHIQLSRGKNVARTIESLSQQPFVEYAEPNYVRHANTNDTFYNYQWGLNNTGQDILGVIGTNNADIAAEAAWTMSTGNPDFVIAVIDSGVEYTHEDLAANIWLNSGEIPDNGVDDDDNGYIDDIYGWDFFSNDNDPMDKFHGTHVAGTICAEANNGIGVSGVAWQCKIMALRFIGPDGGFTDDAIAALNYAVDMGVKLSNNSWGGGGYSQSLYDAIENAGMNGHLFVAAAGNDGENTDAIPHYPSAYNLDNIISVAAIDNQDQLAGFSNYGANSVDVGAPGVNIASTMLSVYYWGSGTSMAAPHVTGIAALLYDSHPDWTPLQVRDRIYNTVRPIDALNGITTTNGVVNAYHALLEPIPPPDALSALILLLLL
ncbi:MAG: S8 family serine peptidase [gamma proteobacterium symbiont of Bathyaustriella thionipta]|nr:S8 family serine peptidase [gamma proteobacterium symbiont of Bathyaustriella thionipta]MCU7949431.1 S8 family serine peptidase [gamma proteobacterium symbiont of Bathyaustriella thionipta]MCU7954033.1 S8 family serine peptidase [gamma proteobacterium symbiont of Bathyaustriella thionipta]MCU7956018.1 S8 family serine peptidase [gamma proteobacterium symbiont of Bathyaustriella thionipta]MCU7967952.1 S8 family serine peptidase [gamma proteobacterium symbiont of Bathyaustriella thionipta]